MTFLISVAAAVGCSICNSGAAVLQKVSADNKQETHGLKLGFLGSLLKDPPYAAGVILDAVGWGLTFYAVQYLPLYFVESIIAASIGITAILERVILHKKLKRTAYAYIGIIFLGLVLLAFSAAPGKAEPVALQTQLILVSAIIPIVAVAAIVSRLHQKWAAFVLGALSGISFGQTSVLSRIFVFYKPLWHTLGSPLLIGLILYGVLGVLLFSIALQRMRATVAAATMTVAQTLVPTIIGMSLFGDLARDGLTPILYIGLAISLVGAVFLALHSDAKK